MLFVFGSTFGVVFGAGGGSEAGGLVFSLEGVEGDEL